MLLEGFGEPKSMKQMIEMAMKIVLVSDIDFEIFLMGFLVENSDSVEELLCQS